MFHARLPCPNFPVVECDVQVLQQRHARQHASGHAADNTKATNMQADMQANMQATSMQAGVHMQTDM